MTTSASVVSWDVTTDAAYRAWGASIAAGLQAVGLVQTADTGQINWATLALTSFPTVSTPSIGYEIYRFSDALQASRPVFIKVEYGYMVGGLGTRAGVWGQTMWITVGTGTNGAGTLTGLVGTRRSMLAISATGSGITDSGVSRTDTHSYFCGDGSSINAALGIDVAIATSNLSGSATRIPVPAVFSIERTRNLDGTYNGDGVVFAFGSWYGIYASSQGQQSGFQILSFTTSQVHNADGFIPGAYPGSMSGSGVVGANVITYQIPVQTGAGVEGPMLGLLACWNGDFTAGQTISVPMYGAQHTYLSCCQVGGAPNTSYFTTNNGSTTGGLLMRYE
jgi:hypothetical protein